MAITAKISTMPSQFAGSSPKFCFMGQPNPRALPSQGHAA